MHSNCKYATKRLGFMKMLNLDLYNMSISLRVSSSAALIFLIAIRFCLAGL